MVRAPEDLQRPASVRTCIREALLLSVCTPHSDSLCGRVGFHRDKGPLTVNVALSADDWHDGGRLLALCEGRVQAIPREEGEATVHPSTLLHGVSRMRGGARYSLICFFKYVDLVLDEQDEG